MSNYPVWWDSKITVYNKYEDPLTRVITWHRTQLDGAFWKYVKDKVSVGETVLEAEKTICRIRENDKFMEKHLWITLPNDQMSQFFTLGVGDIVVKGYVEDEVDEYTSGQRSSDLVAKYKALQGCMEIESVSNNTGVGRGLPHYLASGL